MKKHCKFETCGRPAASRGYCPAHYQQFKSGKELVPLFLSRRQNGSAPRIEYVEKACLNQNLDGPCHIWTKAVNRDGYAIVSVNGRTIKLHRYMWETFVGPIPDGLEIDHQCMVKNCCNVKHLRVVTRRVNVLENSNGVSAVCARKTHCVRGHPFDGENTIRTARGTRRCRACKMMGDIAYRSIRARPRVPPSHCPRGHPYDGANMKLTKEGHRKCKACNAEYVKRNRSRITEYERQRKERHRENSPGVLSRV